MSTTSSSTCCLCHEVTKARLTLCSACLSRISEARVGFPQQALSSYKGQGVGWLVDAWARGHALGRHTTIVGRSRSAGGVQIMHASVSKMNSRITREGNGAWFVEDLSSTNGTWVGGTRIKSDRKKVLRHGDVLNFGQVRMGFCSAPRATESELLESARQEADGATPVLNHVLGVTTPTPTQRTPVATPALTRTPTPVPRVPTPAPVPVESAVLMCGLKSVNVRGEQILLARRFVEQARFDVEIDAAEGAFVHAEELCELTSRRTEKQLDRLLMELCALFHAAGIALTIEVKPGQGYRLKPMSTASEVIILSHHRRERSYLQDRGRLSKRPSWAKPT